MNTQNSLSGLPDELHPCEHMIGLLSRRSDLTLKGPAKWYTDFHVRTCVHCRTALQGLRKLRDEVAILAAEPPPEPLKMGAEQWEAIEAQLS